ncbi:MAG TPA: tail fiber protein [Fimbriimonadaceae bacterium]|nr:tail fiber protein [Fimbriimonadaceae bacterium]
MSDQFLGEIRNVAFTFAPKGWAICDGSLLSIAQNTALFSLLGTTYGGNGTTNFALPDFRGRIAIGQGTGPGLSPYALGQQGGQESYTLQTQELPSHNHNMPAASEQATTTNPSGAFFGMTGSPQKPADLYGSPGNVNAYTEMVQKTGGGQGHENRQPLLTTLFVIALVGIFPSRS